MKIGIIIISFACLFICHGGSFAQDDIIDDISSEKVSESLNPGGENGALKKSPLLSQRWLLSVGIRKFADTRITPLTYTAKDAKSIESYFRQDHVPDSQIYLLTDEAATKENIIQALEKIKNRVTPRDTFLFFFSSHGVGDNEGRTYFVTFDTVLDELSRTALPMQHIKEMVKSFNCRNVVMLADTCHSGGVKSLKQQNEASYDKIVRAAGQNTRVAILTSSRTHETSAESPQWGHGAFTYYMLEGLSGNADNFPKDGKVSVTELFDHVMIAVPRATNRAQHPSGKFSYNWPGKKDQAVAFGRVVKDAAPGAPAEKSRDNNESRSSGSKSDGWDNVLNDSIK